MATSPSSRLPSARESAAAATVCVALCAALAWLVHTQSRFSPAVDIAFHEAKAAAGAVHAKAQDLVSPLPAALRPMSAAEAFAPETLSDKIDGKAEVYLSASVAGLRCQRLALAAAPSSWIELFVYDMRKPSNAYSVYSSQRRSDVTDLQLADYAYRAGNEIALVHGPFYVEVVATDEGPATIEAASALARAYVAATPVSAHADVSTDQALFPREGLVPGSVTLLSTDVFGFDGLGNVYVARFRDGRDEVTLFLARRTGIRDAAAAAVALRGFFVDDCGGKEVARPALPAGSVIIDAGGSFEGVFNTGAFLAGVHQAPSREGADRWLKRLSASLAGKK
jgi:hypothetical protein